MLFVIPVELLAIKIYVLTHYTVKLHNFPVNLFCFLKLQTRQFFPVTKYIRRGFSECKFFSFKARLNWITIVKYQMTNNLKKVVIV